MPRATAQHPPKTISSAGPRPYMVDLFNKGIAVHRSPCPGLESAVYDSVPPNVPVAQCSVHREMVGVLSLGRRANVVAALAASENSPGREAWGIAISQVQRAPVQGATGWAAAATPRNPWFVAGRSSIASSKQSATPRRQSPPDGGSLRMSPSIPRPCGLGYLQTPLARLENPTPPLTARPARCEPPASPRTGESGRRACGRLPAALPGRD